MHWSSAEVNDNVSWCSRFSPSGNQEQDWVNLLMASPLFKQINDLEQMLNKSPDSTASEGLAADTVQGTGLFRFTGILHVVAFSVEIRPFFT